MFPTYCLSNSVHPNLPFLLSSSISVFILGSSFRGSKMGVLLLFLVQNCMMFGWPGRAMILGPCCWGCGCGRDFKIFLLVSLIFFAMALISISSAVSFFKILDITIKAKMKLYLATLNALR